MLGGPDNFLQVRRHTLYAAHLLQPGRDTRSLSPGTTCFVDLPFPRGNPQPFHKKDSHCD